MSGQTADNSKISLRSYVDAQIDAVRRTLEHESHDRETTANALRAEHANAMQLAADEREKAANALRSEADRATRDGDERLREHIEQAVKQIEANLASADKLEVSRIQAVTDQLHGLREYMLAQFIANKDAITKAEEAQKSYNASHNDLLRKMDDQHKDTLPRLEADEKFKASDARYENIRQEVQGLRESRSQGAGVVEQRTAGRQMNQWVIGILVGVVLAAAAILGHLLR